MIPHIARRYFGLGRRRVLAIHCSLARSGAWRGLARCLEDQITIHAFDLPNHGRSGDWDGTGDLHDIATAMARAVLDDLGPEPVDVIGHSFGATVALRLAVEAPDKLRSAVLFEPVYFAPALSDDPGFAARHGQADADYEAAYGAGNLARAAQVFNDYWGGGMPWDRVPEPARAYMTERIGFVHHSAPFLIRDSAGLMPRLGQARVPILMMRGGASPYAEAVNAALVRRLPHVQEVVLPGQGHLAPITAPASLAPHVASFLDDPLAVRPVTAD